MTKCYLLQVTIHHQDDDDCFDRFSTRPIAIYETEEEAHKAIDKDKICDKILEEYDGDCECDYSVVRLPFVECALTK